MIVDSLPLSNTGCYGRRDNIKSETVATNYHHHKQHQGIQKSDPANILSRPAAAVCDDIN
eukprot:936712-Ditylum_brightwellii.AAC.1